MRLRLLPLFALLLALAACDDVPGLGLDIVQDPGGIPQGTRTLVASVTTGDDVDYTGGSGSATTTTPQHALAGIVNDPSLGTITATPSLEVGAATGTNLASFRGKAIDKVTLSIPLKRYYGDTTSAVTYELRALAKDLTSVTIPSDSVLATDGAVLATGTLGRRDSVLTLTLPASWIQANTARLRATSDSLVGFQLTPTSGGQIRFLPFGSALLTAVAGTDTARYAGSLAATRIVRTGTTTLTADERLLQDGFPKRLDVPFDTTGMRSAALARVSLVVPFDSTRLITPAGFLRPAFTTVTLLGVKANGSLVAFNSTPFGRTVPAKGRMVFTSEALRRVFQDRKLGGRDTSLASLRSFALSFDDVANGLPAVVVSATGPNRPYYVFTTVGN